MDKLCGNAGVEPWLNLHFISPCFFESGASAATALVLLATVLLQFRRLRYHAASRPDGPMGGMGPQKGGVTGGEGAFITLSGFVCTVHLVHLIVNLMTDQLRGLPYHTLFHAVLVASWVMVVVLSVRGSRSHVPIDFRPWLVCMFLTYLYTIVDFFVLYNNFADGDTTAALYPLSYLKTSTWTALLQIVSCLGLLFLDRSLQKNVKLDPNGYVRLPGEMDEEEMAGTEKEVESRTWITLFFAAFVYVWPENKALQLRAMLCFLLLLSMRFLNLLVPILYKKVVDILANAAEQGSADFWTLAYPWPMIYLACVFFQGGAGGGLTGLINNTRSFLWIPVAQDAFKRVSVKVFAHVLSLDLAFHLSKKTGEVTKQVSRGTDAMQNILSTILFSIVPQLIDVLSASTYLAQALEPTIAIIMFITVASYMPVTIIITEWRGNLRREVNRTDQACAARVTDALINYETVKYFTNDAHECDKFQESIREYQSAEFKSSASLNLLNGVQSMIMFFGISSGLLVCVNGVAQGRLSVGDVVLFLAMMAQLYTPLSWFGSNYRVIQTYMIDCENLFALLDRKPAIQDTPRSHELVVREGEIEFEHVWLEYEHKHPVLRGVSFTCPGGSTIAFVGATGSGKSTIARLMFRLYDVTFGAIRIDGVDVRNVKLESLRKAIGMVPQDTVLFNDSIMLNIEYGCVGAPVETVYEASKAACIHETITTRFPKGYDTVVGERGLRLSGGEKQRVAFARTVLKNPPILVLDEATSALDSLTERKIQEALLGLRKKRTTMIIAHRLSTIADADTIVVMDKGNIIEMGKHEELLEKGGLYQAMWSKQSHEGESGLGSKAASSANLTELPAVAAANDLSKGTGKNGGDSSSGGGGGGFGGHHQGHR